LQKKYKKAVKPMGNFKLGALYPGAGIIVTYKCSAACLHCCYSSSPKRDGAYMPEETADKIFALLHKMGCRSVHIGGGEPFMNFEKLLAVCESAARHRVAIDYIETNASWYTGEDAAALKLKKLKSAGVDCLLISVDPFHNEFIPYNNIKNLANACRKCGVGTFLWQSRFERVVAQMDESAAHPLEEYERLFGGDFIKTIAESYGIGYNGRALRILERISRNKQPYGYFLKDAQCSERITSLGHFHVDLHCNFIPPSCNGFTADIFDLCGGGLDGEKYINFMSVVSGGLPALFDRAVSFGFIPDGGGYASKCALCFDIKKYIYENTGAPADIGPPGFYEES